MDHWDKCAGVVDPDALLTMPCYAGLDLAATTDIAALVLLFPDLAPGYQVLPFFWIPEERAAEREKKDRVPYLTWGRQGFVEMTEGNSIDYDVIRKKVTDLGEKYQIKQIAIDKWNALQLATQLQKDGFDVMAFRQGMASMTAPTKELLKILADGSLAHGGHPVFRWMASNVAGISDASGNLRPDKEKSAEKIDGIVALIMALGVSIAQGGVACSVYEKRGLFEW
jgi:phage terminase large subunit-like protein